MTSLKKNTFFNFLLTFSSLMFPLITMPYISRVLSIADIGLVNRGTAFYTFFLNFSTFGLVSYAAREIARCRDDKEETNEVFFSVLICHCITTFIFLFIFISYIFTIDDSNTKKILIFNAILLAISPFTIEWFYIGKEEFRYISIRSIIVKFVTFISVFIFVRKEADFVKYAFLTVIAQGANTIFNIFNVRKYVKFHRFSLPLKKMFKGSSFFYLQTLVAICYQNLNQIFLGNSNTTELALFVRATTFSALTSAFISPVGNAVKPRIENILNKDNKEYMRYINIAFDCTMSLLCPVVFGMGILSSNIMAIFGGKQFIGGGHVLVVVLFSAFFSQLSTFMNNIIAIPTGNEKNTFFANTCVAVLSIVLNIFWIKKYGAMGAAFALLFSEMLGSIIQFLLIKKTNLYIKWLQVNQLKYLISSILMAVTIYFIKKIFQNIYIETFVSVLVGVITYTSFTLLICFVTRTEKPFLIENFIKIARKNK